MRERSLILVFCLLLVPAVSWGGDGEEWTASWSNGHKIAKGDAFELKFGGRIQADFTLARADAAVESAFGADELDDGFEFRRARVFLSGTVYERVLFKAEYDFAGGDPSFKDVYIGLDQSWGKLLFGHAKEPFGLEELTSSKYIAFVERSLPTEAFAPSRNSGVHFSGARGDRLNWGLAAAYDADDFGDSIEGDRKNLTARVGFRPLYRDKGRRVLHLGAALNHRSVESSGTLRFRSRPEAHLTTRFVDTGSFPADSALILGLEAAGVHDRLWWAAEHMSAEVDSPGLGDPSFSGSYLQVGYFLTGKDYRRFKPGGGQFDRQKPSESWNRSGGRGAWEMAARYSTLDLADGAVAGGELDSLTLALNWYLNPVARLMVNWVRADRSELGEADFVLVRWAIDF